MNKRLRLLRQAFLLAVAAAISFTSCKKSDSNNSTNPNPPDPPPSGDTVKVVKAGGKSVCYVEVNNESMLNVAKYKLTDSGQQLFDIAIIFAANINYDTVAHKAILSNNNNVTNVLVNKATQIVPLQQKGTKVLLSILGNHQGAGFCNFTSRAAAKAFAQQLSDTVNFYGLDGIDFDDEYAEYGKYGTTQPNDSSFVMLLDELHKLIPNKLITMYFYGPAASRLSYNGTTAGSILNYSWNAIYGTYSVPNIAGMSKNNLSPAAVDLQGTSQATAVSLATQTKTNGYGVYMWYNLSSGDKSAYLSAVSNVLYGTGVTYTP